MSGRDSLIDSVRVLFGVSSCCFFVMACFCCRPESQKVAQLTPARTSIEVGSQEKGSTLMPEPKPPASRIPKFISMRPIASVPQEAANNSVAITMDMEVKASIEDLLQALRKHNAKMTFFICGNWGKRNKSLIKRMLDEGHELGNHTISHAWLTKISAESVKKELNSLESLVKEATDGGTTLPLMRPPGGLKNHNVERIARDLGYRIIMWNVSAGDAVHPRPSAAQVFSRIRLAKPGSIILTHSFCRGSTEAIIKYLDYLEQKKMKAVTVSELILNAEKWAREKPEKAASSKASVDGKEQPNADKAIPLQARPATKPKPSAGDEQFFPKSKGK